MPEPSTFKPVTDAVKQATKDIGMQMTALGNDVSSKLRGALDEEMQEVLDWGEKIADRAHKIITPFLSSVGLWVKQSKFAENTMKYMKKMLSIEEWRVKLQKAGIGLTKNSIFKTIMKGLAMAAGIAGGMLGAIIAPLVGKITEPIRLIGKLMKTFGKTKAFTAITTFLKGEGKILSGLRKAFGVFNKFFGGIKKLAAWIMKSPFGKGFLIGFKKSMNWIFWPIQAVISAMEFIKGWSQTQGDMIDKFYGGLGSVLKEFFGVPLRILGDIVDWVIQKFGFEKLGLGEKFEGAFGAIVDTLFKIPIGFKNLIKEYGGLAIEKIRDKIKSMNFGEMFSMDGLFEMFAEMKKSISEWLLKILQSGPVKYILGNTEMYKNLMNTLQSDVDAAKGMNDQKSLEEEKLKLMRAQNAKLDELNQKALGNQQIVTNEEGGYQGGGPTPDHLPTSRDVTSNPFNDVAWGM